VLWPGTYTLTVRLQASGADLVFPVVVDVVVPKGATAAARTLTINANTVDVGGSIDGTNQVQSENSAGRPLNLPTGLTVTRNLTAPPTVDVNGTPVPPASVGGEGTITPGTSTTAAVTAAADKGSYSFVNLPFNVYTLGFAPADGFTTPGSITVDVHNNTAATPTTAIYRAPDVLVKVYVRSDHGTPSNTADDVDLATAQVTIQSPAAGSTPLTMNYTAASPHGYYSLSVPPEIGAYSLTIAADLHTTRNELLVVDPQKTGVLDVQPPYLLTLSQVAVSGQVTRQDLTGGSSTLTPPVGTQAYLTLTDGTVVQGPVSLVNGRYSFNATAGTYDVKVSATGYRTANTADLVPPHVVVPAATAGAGINVPSLVLRKNITLSYSVTDEGNQPLTGVNIAMQGAGSSGSTVSGLLSLAAVAGDTLTYTATAAADGYAPTSGTADQTQTNNLVMHPSIVGTITRDTGTSPALTVYLCTAASSAASCDSTTAVQTTSTTTAAPNQGQYKFRAAPGDYWVKGVEKNTLFYDAREIKVTANGSLDPAFNTVTFDVTTPSTPTAPTATSGTSGTTLDFAWTNVSVVPVEVSLDGTTWTPLTAGTTSYTFTALSPGTSYTARVRAHSTAGISGIASRTVTTTVPAPTGLLLTPGDTTVDASWTTSAGVTYEVRIFVTTAGSGGVTWRASDTASSATFTGLANGTGYTVQVRAVANGINSSTVQGTISTTSPPPPTT
jgi:hypothetical protein